MDRCQGERGDLAEAIALTARAKAAFTAEDVHARARRTLERCILHGTTRMRTQRRGRSGDRPARAGGRAAAGGEYRWAIDLEICVFPQEGLLNNPGTVELMVAALRGGATVVGGAPYTDTDPARPDRPAVRAGPRVRRRPRPASRLLARCHDLDLLHVCAQTERHGCGGRVAIGHVSKLSMLPPDRLARPPGAWPMPAWRSPCCRRPTSI